MKALGIITAILAPVITLPIAFYLQYRILVAVEATNVMWLLFWVYVPIFLITQIIARVIEQAGKK